VSPAPAWEALVVRLVTSRDPEAELARARRDETVRAALERVDPDGLRLAALLVAKLRFERLLRGCPEAEDWFEDDPIAFAEVFRAYHHEVPPTAFFPPEEAALFRVWRAGPVAPG
jgi:hypothetical protein